MNIRDYMETIQYKITEGSDYLWDCFGQDSFRLDSYELDRYSVGIIFDTKTQVVYQADAHDYIAERSYVWTNPDFKEKYYLEANRRQVDVKNAYDDVYYVELEEEQDFFDKAAAIVQGKPYDTRVSVPLELPDDALFELMKQAHLQDITLNQFVEKLLKEEIDKRS